MVEKISFAERMRRLEAGYASSPQYARILADTFCRAQIIPALEECGSFYEREKLCNLLRDESLKKYLSAFDFGELQRKDIEDVTFGDVALLITAHYLKDGTKHSLEVEELTSIYFSCIETLALERKIPRGDLKECLLPIYDFLRMSFVEYYEYAKQCGLNQHEDKIADYRAFTGMSSHMTLLKVLDELKMESCGYRERYFEFSPDQFPPPLVDCEYFIELFVCPVVMMWTLPFIGQ